MIKNRAWILRGKPGEKDRETEFFENNFFATGWGGIGDISGLSRKKIYEALELNSEYKNYNDNKKGMTAAILNYIANEIDVDNLVLMPNDKKIYVGKVSEAYFFDKNKNKETYPHTIKVKWEKIIFRDHLPIELRKSLRAWQTIANIDKHYNIVKKIFENDNINESELNSIEDTNYLCGDYPLRKNLNIPYKVPTNMTKKEAERFGEFIKSLVLD